MISQKNAVVQNQGDQYQNHGEFNATSWLGLQVKRVQVMGPALKITTPNTNTILRVLVTLTIW